MTEPASIALSRAQEAAATLTQAAQRADGAAYWGLKAFIGVNLFYWHLAAFDSREDPVPAFIDICREAEGLFEASRRSATGTCVQLAAERQDPPSDYASMGALYGAVYSAMSDSEYFEESRRALAGRLEANGVDPSELFDGRIVLDAGCGGGKFSQAIASFGAKLVIGVDIDESNIDFARAQGKKARHGEAIEYRIGSVLDLPVPDRSVDLAWCNSVAHLTGNQKACLRELARVIRPGGMLFYYVNGRFGLFEILLGTLRVVMAGVPKQFIQHWLQAMGVRAGRIAWVIACLFAPYEFVPRSQVETMLHDAGFERLRLLDRGIDFDHSEKIARGEPHARVKYGEGELRYLAEKV